MTLEEAEAGQQVSYAPPAPVGRPREHGIVTSKNATYVFVRFPGAGASHACRPQDLQLEVDPKDLP